MEKLVRKIMKGQKVLFMPRMEAPALGDRPEPALQAMIHANQRVIDFAMRAFEKRTPFNVPASEVAHLIGLFQKSEILCEIAARCFPFSESKYEKFRSHFKEKAEYLHELFIEAMQREIAINCQKAGA
jgi:hypothetical protein